MTLEDSIFILGVSLVRKLVKTNQQTRLCFHDVDNCQFRKRKLKLISYSPWNYVKER